MNLKEPTTKCLSITLLLSLLLLLPLHAAAALHFQFGIEPNYTLTFTNPAKGYFKDLNEDFRTGIYTWEIPMPDWKDIKTPSFNEFGGEISCIVKVRSGKIKKPRVGVVLGYRISGPSSRYNENYEKVYDPFTKKTADYFRFSRQENIRTSTFFLGARGKASLTDKLDASATVGVSFYNVKGDIDYTRKTMAPGYPEEYVEWRKADYKGNTTGFMIEAGIDYKIIKNIFIGAALSYRTGKVKTKGEEVKTRSGDIFRGVSWTRDYSPEFNFNSAYGKFYVGMSF